MVPTGLLQRASRSPRRGGKYRKRRNSGRKKGEDQPAIAVLTVDKRGIFEVEGQLEEYKVVEVAIDRNKFAYYTKSNVQSEAASKVPKEYKGHLVFEPKYLEGLLEYSPQDYEIKLKEGAQLKFFKIYYTNRQQNEELKKYLEENLKRGYIQPSTLLAGYPILFIPKKDRKLRLYVDYRQLNNQTVKNRYLLLLISRLRDQLASTKFFIRLDLPSAYNYIRIKEGDEQKTTFRILYRYFEYLVIPFGLTNALVTFQSLIDYTIRPFLDKFAVYYLDDILIFSKTLAEHRKYIRAVLDALYQYKLSVNKEKSEFYITKTVFLGYKISPGQIRIEPSKVEAIKNWPTPTNVIEVRGFIRFINFYQIFIKGYSNIARPLYALIGKKAEFRQGKEQEDVFYRIKELIVAELVLVLLDLSKPFEVEANSLDYAIGGQLGQRDENGKLYPMAFFSKKLSSTQLNYPIYNKELLAIVEAFKEQRLYLNGIVEPVKVYTDYKNLRYFTTIKELNRRQICQVEFLLEFNFEIHYKKGNENARIDALSRRPDYLKEQYKAIGATSLLFRPTTDRTLQYDLQLVDDPLDILKECYAAF